MKGEARIRIVTRTQDLAMMVGLVADAVAAVFTHGANVGYSNVHVLAWKAGERASESECLVVGPSLSRSARARSLAGLAFGPFPFGPLFDLALMRQFSGECLLARK